MIKSKTAKLCCAAAVAAAMALTVGAAPALALTDTAVDAKTDSVLLADQETPSSDAMPDNPTVDLPQTVSDDIPDDATVVSTDLAVTPEGEVKDIETGETITDPELVGTKHTQADPLAKTDGDSFIPVDAGTVKDAVNSDSNTADGAEGTTQGAVSTTSSVVRLAALGGNEYGAHWGKYNGSPAFFEGDNSLFAQKAKGVVDVSEWQHKIDWAKAKADGVQGAIIRIGYGWGNGLDATAQYNIDECKRLGIPFGVYLYSYAENANTGKAEGQNVVNLLNQAGVSPKDLSYPVFYDLERWTWTGHQPPTSPKVYESIVNAWYGVLKSAGYTNLSIYSYTTYLNGPLNSSSLHAKTRWVAQYGAQMTFTGFSTNDRGWQYTSGGSVKGISGRADLNAFGVATVNGTSNESGNENNNSGDVNGSDNENATNPGDATYLSGTGYYVSNSLKGGTADFSFSYGDQGDLALAGDWDGDGKDSVAVRRSNEYLVRNSLSSGKPDVRIRYGRGDDTVLVGDWDGDGKDTFAVRRGNAYYFKNSVTSGEADVVIRYGRADDQVFVGDWDGDGKDTLVVRRGNAYYFKNSISGGEADTVIRYGRGTDEVLIGDWNGDGKDTLAVRRDNKYFVKNSISGGEADTVFHYGRGSDNVLVGDWDGDGKDTFIVHR
ncbi:glycoside hydrolase family 25 protein [Bifidobacterium sp. 82T10]|uniref:Glycoside hydrolase family 25 protein n=1 Tax=Bifidobacterium miconis TaxID=2834435 RepID=A0ABS6WH27_9BIFI|nr:glycoside hydrolase family 25 protein [Bifidobacterium miconis]MBW3093177.1 glycoside hydrolase family 25 protein [Bifidobacterium miconis]